jgi:hypothetical protein
VLTWHAKKTSLELLDDNCSPSLEELLTKPRVSRSSPSIELLDDNCCPLGGRKRWAS